MLQSDAHLNIPSPYYRVSLKGLVFDKDNRLLVIQAKDGLWELPGGGWEHKESMQYCLRRKIIDELGVGVTHIDFKTIYPYSAKGRTGYMRLNLAIPVTLHDHEFLLNKAYVKAHNFVTASELASLDMADSEVGIKTHIQRLWPIG